MIHVRDIGIGLDGRGGPGQLRRLERRLGQFRSLGFRLVEIDITSFHLILDGEIHRSSLENWLAVLRRFDLRYSIHGLLRLNLAYDARHSLCRQIMRCQIEICRAAGASVLVVHSGLQALDEVRYGVRPALLSPEELDAGARREADAFQELAPLAADAGVALCMENGDPHQWEYALLARHGLPRAAISEHHARLHVEPMVRQLEAIDRPNVGMALDVGHLYIAAHELGVDYLEAVHVAAPWVKHLHVSDNFGRLDRGFDAEPERWAFGEADVHMPPGWGRIPYGELLARLPRYEGDMILEIKPGFIEYAEQGLRTMEKYLVRGPAGHGLATGPR
jgi:sugar phosphate isomerase/epimerase